MKQPTLSIPSWSTSRSSGGRRHAGVRRVCLSVPEVEKPGQHALKRDDLWAESVNPGTRVRCERGVLWLTLEGHDEDVILQAGEAFTADRGGRAVVQALEAGCFEVSRAA